MSSKGPDRIEADPEILQDGEIQQSFMNKALKVVAKVPFVRDVVAFYFAVLDPEVPIAKKAILAGAVLYFLSPIDFIPDFLGVVGFSDDFAVASITMASVRDILTERHYDQADDALGRDHRGVSAWAKGG